MRSIDEKLFSEIAPHDSFEQRWFGKLKELQSYKAKHGDCSVPRKFPENPKLSNWVQKQRKEYKRKKEGNPTPITEERIEALERLGFDWSFQQKMTWGDRLVQLREYKEKHGDCNVPYKFPKNQQLSKWVQTQREDYKKLIEGNSSSMTEERMKALDGLGFEWSFQQQVDWKVRLKELMEYKENNGHCNVPRRFTENPRLGNWVQQQRDLYKRFNDGKSSSLTEDRIAALEDLGFEWSIRHPVNWKVRFEELQQYKVEHGNCNVPLNFPENIQLGRWVNMQRVHYKKFKEGNISLMSQERIAKLDKLGFEWQSKLQKDWELRFEELKQYKRKYGDCCVACKFPENPQLGSWVSTQRVAYKKMLQGTSSAMTKERFRQLQEIGFKW
eukprot:CAMPEP_0195514126 /NCGR_PEP_ID=MMETSP0794_2-20130614/5601_1 /TAXON_ID=515487 /ORGANISM="Stephanopyxis turris, Strain CCMP 815" /LENGTH=384 /DNA_ID=CAMNT_0040642295 /DNA_START=179 /DNA_END=1330 /DNA_ORIENTATION=+